MNEPHIAPENPKLRNETPAFWSAMDTLKGKHSSEVRTTNNETLGPSREVT
jgi:hypothetical protein